MKQYEGREARRRRRDRMAVMYLTRRSRYVSFLDLHLDGVEGGGRCAI
jgi:hypothetical protein